MSQGDLPPDGRRFQVVATEPDWNLEDVLALYADWVDRGELYHGRRVTIMTTDTACRTNETLRVDHVLEAVRPGHDLYVMGPKPVFSSTSTGYCRALDRRRMKQPTPLPRSSMTDGCSPARASTPILRRPSIASRARAAMKSAGNPAPGAPTRWSLSSLIPLRCRRRQGMRPRFLGGPGTASGAPTATQAHGTAPPDARRVVPPGIRGPPPSWNPCMGRDWCAP